MKKQELVTTYRKYNIYETATGYKVASQNTRYATLEDAFDFVDYTWNKYFKPAIHPPLER